jgi:hypothetical protein
VTAAHVGGLPLEELAPALAGAGGSLMLVRAWLMLRFRDQRRRRTQS